MPKLKDKKVPPHQRLACIPCAGHKVRCDKALPRCGRCNEKRAKCIYRSAQRGTEKQKQTVARDKARSISSELQESRQGEEMSLQFSTFDTFRSPDGDPHPFAQTGQDLCLTDQLFQFLPPDHPDQGPAGWDDNIAETNTGTESAGTEDESTIEIPRNSISRPAEHGIDASRMDNVGATSTGSPSPAAATAPVKRPGSQTAPVGPPSKRPKVKDPGSRTKSTHNQNVSPTPMSLTRTPCSVSERGSGQSDTSGFAIPERASADGITKMALDLEERAKEAEKRATEAEKRATEADKRATAAEQGKIAAEQSLQDYAARVEALEVKFQNVQAALSR